MPPMRRRFTLARCARCRWLVQYTHYHDDETQPLGVWFHPLIFGVEGHNPCSEPVPTHRRPLSLAVIDCD